MIYDPHNLDIMAKTLWAEARGEPEEGMLAVGWVIRNRAERSGYAGSLVGSNGAVSAVCLAPWQFSCWNKNDPNYAKLEVLALDEYVKEQELAIDVLGGIAPDPTGGADCYYAPAGMPGGVAPPWAASMHFCGKFGTQFFYDSRIPAPTYHVLYEGCALPDEVKRLQVALSVAADGSFGPKTKSAVADFQEFNRLTVDGVAGPQTLKALNLA